MGAVKNDGKHVSTYWATHRVTHVLRLTGGSSAPMDNTVVHG